MDFNVDKCNVMHICPHYMNNSALGTANEEKDLGVIITDELMVSRHCASAYSKANRILGMNKEQ